VTLKSRLGVTQDHWKWHNSKAYRFAFAFHNNCGSNLHHFREILVENRDFFIPTLHSTPPLGSPRRNIAIMFGVEKLEWCGYMAVKMRIYSAVSTEYRRVTDGQADILRQHSPRYAYASRGKNRDFRQYLALSRK